ncbi:MAG TPA: PQQ-binding-like beta-propeller repeat protein, partial [Verrucomicrobiae bacterium]|nr:PQQ-binding-like beta-propeller repeat protein [Verrucomicrobiae bacterium]
MLCWFLILALSTHLAVAGDVYFRSDRGVASEASKLPENFEAPFWKTDLSPGQSTPVISGGRIFLTSFDSRSNELATIALDMETGRSIWKQIAPASRIEQVHRVGSPASATPACDGKRLYVFFGSYGLICYDLDGKRIWEHPFPPFQDEFGAASSPVLVDGKVILAQDHDINSFVMALDAATGKQLWKTDRPDAVRSYSTPVIWNRGDKKEILVAGALQLASYDPASGKQLWSKDGLARIVIPMPVFSGDMVYMASWAPGGDSGQRLSLDSWHSALAKWDANKDGLLAKAEINNPEVLDRFFRMDLDQSGTLNNREWDRHAEVFKRAQNAILALKPSGSGELSEGDLVWKYQRGVPYVATPLVDQGSVWMVKDGGIVTRLDARTGRVLHEERLPGIGNYFASPVTGDGKVYFASDLGVLSVVSAGPEWKVLGKHEFHERINATPVINNGRLYVR